MSTSTMHIATWWLHLEVIGHRMHLDTYGDDYSDWDVSCRSDAQQLLASITRFDLIVTFVSIGLASDDVTKLSNAWQRGKLVLNKDSAPYKSMLGEKSLYSSKNSSIPLSSLFLLGEIGTVLTTPSRLSASHFKRSRESDKCGAVFQSLDDLPACFSMGRYLCLEPILPVATPVAGL